MFSGKGELITPSGNRVSLTINMVSLDGPGRVGHLRCNTAEFEPMVFLYPLQLKCEDGTSLDIAVTNYSDGQISFIGRLAS